VTGGGSKGWQNGFSLALTKALNGRAAVSAVCISPVWAWSGSDWGEEQVKTAKRLLLAGPLVCVAGAGAAPAR
jgi:hypothetical protein